MFGIGKSQDTVSSKREIGYAAGGMLLGVMAPIGWGIVRLILFWDPDQTITDQVIGDIVRSNQSLAHYLYMGFGTAMVLGAFGFFIGRATQQIHDRAGKLDRLNHDIEEQKQTFEKRFTDLDRSIKNFHVINTDLQRSVNRSEVLRLAANGLHEVIGYDRVNVLMVSDDETQLSFAVSRGVNLDNNQSSATIPLDERAGCIFKSIRDRQVLLIDDITKMPEEYHLQPPCDALPQIRSRSFILCPVVVRGKAVGLLGVDNKYKRSQLTDTDVDTIKLFADQISSSIMRINLLDAVEDLTRQLEHTFNEFLKYREEHGSLIKSLHEAVDSTSRATTEIDSGAGVIQESVNATRSAAGEISVSIEQVSNSLKTLNEFMDRSIAAMTEIQYTVSAVEENSARSHTMSEAVRSKAKHGVSTVDSVLDGMRGIVSSVEQAEEIIRQLSEKGEEVGSVTSVVTDLTQKTSLLALNAAIIAAQAGEHGRSFAVVADEVRTLAQEAAVSTDQINQIIEEIQTFTRQTVEHIIKTRTLVDQGLEQGEDMAGVLSQILESSNQAMEMAHDIRTSTQEIAQAVNGVSKSVEELGEMSAQVSQASKEQAGGAKSIVASVEEVRSMTDDMVQATSQQTENARQIDSAVEQVSTMARRIFDEMEERRQGSLSVIEDLRRLKQGESVEGN